MKKNLMVFVLIILVLFFVPGAVARISFGVKGGVNLASISVSPKPFEVSAFRTLSGPCGGIFFNLPLGSFNLQTEFMYARRGTQYEACIDAGFCNVHWQHDYLEAILLLRWSGGSFRQFRPVIFAGPSWGYLSRAFSVVYDLDGKKVDEVDSRDYFRKGELAAVFGGGVEYDLRPIKFLLEARYHLGLTSVALSGFEVDYIKNRSLAIMAGVSF
ncbi:MAG: porin family protein [Candidatus Saccharicenans sp.]